MRPHARDIRDLASVSHEDVVGLNFIRADGPYCFRRHYRNGLRSHVMEVLLKDDVRRETEGRVVDGVTCFPAAVPVKMLRIFRRRFRRFQEALDETRRVKTVEKHLTARHIARSNEFIVEYRVAGRREIVLCGLQEFLPGEELDPWNPMRPGEVPRAIRALREAGGKPRRDDARLTRRFTNGVETFVAGVKRMIREAGHVPDLAGRGNLLLSASGDIKLVDINNISRVDFSDEIPLDDIGYPVCDKSLEALALLERHLLGRAPDPREPCYRHFLDPDRTRRVAGRVRDFHRGHRDFPSGR